ncbi:sodium/proton antiporter NhaS3, CPA2 family [[Leptolyngbya] sp. PCC 7376]|uniref:cation:proton antiporter n=1 Tax=[Leptolyngbya] sp. PCC 7376 TaxID=111781 RepID=UPI00029F15D4|nr:cation:proton antiporter [[Leptolyngbya] sp. PCC 7376]AFY37414.1 sodium/proton antiporter NhaS3, CPA2 family [[Leptolyngbya] sp. PCC 7376]
MAFPTLQFDFGQNLLQLISLNFDGFHGLSNLTLATTPESEYGSFVLTGVLMTIVVIYAMSKIGGELSKRVGLPPVLGELLGGVLVGVSAFHLIVFPETGAVAADSLMMSILQKLGDLDPTAMNHIFESQSEVISVLAELGVIVLLFEIGLESDLRELTKVGSQAAVVAVVGVVAPFLLGTVGLVALFHAPVIPAIFAGAALTATSIGITSKVLSDLGQLKSTEGTIIVGAAVIDDVLGIIVLAVVASLAKTGEVDLLNVVYLVIGASAFLLGSILLGKFFNKSFEAIAGKLQTRGALLIPACAFALVMAIIANSIHLEAILGAFAAGLVLDETDLRKELDRLVMPVADLLVPIFFVTVGAKADLGVLNPFIEENRAGLIIATFLVVVAIVGKVITGWAVFGKPGINRLAVGFGMIPRGEVGLVFAGIGSASGVLDKPLEAAIIVMVIVTTFIAPPLLQLVLDNPDDGDLDGTKADLEKPLALVE